MIAPAVPRKSITYPEVKVHLHIVQLDDARASGPDLRLHCKVVAWLLVFSGQRYLFSP